MVRVCGVVLIALFCAADATAQIVRGTVRDADSGSGLQGVFIMLLDSAGAMRGGVLTDAQGVFATRAPLSGTFTLRAERIGHQSATSGPVVLTPAEARTVDMTVSVAAIALAPVEVETRNRCSARPRTGERTAQLWEEARKALAVARWVENQKQVQFATRTYVRELDAKTMHVKSEGVRHDVSRRLPYAAIPADTLAKYGFVRNDGAGFVFYGPDADVLLSPAFLDGHCFRSIDGSGTDQGLVGLGFRPAVLSKLPDIEGILWLDRATLELRHIEYRYTNVEPEYRGRDTGGRTEFLRLKSGAWIVSNWFIRMPTVVRSTLERGEVRVVTLREEGGEVVRVQDEGTSHTLVQDGVVSGIVYDSVAGRPLGGALVYLSGTARQSTTDTQGRFQIEGVSPGKYTITFSHARLDSMPALPEPRTIEVAPLGEATIGLAIRSVTSQLASKCAENPAQRIDPRSGAVFGHVRNERASGVSGATVTIQLNSFRAIARTDATGYYLICHVPLESTLAASAARPDEPPTVQRVRIAGLPYRRLDFTLKD